MVKRINLIIVLALFWVSNLIAQETSYQKKVLESTEVDILMSYYAQDGIHSSVAGGEGTEELTDYTSSIVISMPINNNDVLTIDVGISAYTSASSSNINPFDRSGASKGENEEEDEDEEEDDKRALVKGVDNGLASPWYASSGASESDVLVHGSANYSHSSEDRNTIVSGNIGFSTEYDYFSIGVGGSFTKLFNEKNTEISLRAQAYFDTWKSIYPTELDTYLLEGGLDADFFQGVTITGNPNYSPTNFAINSDEQRNSYSFSASFSQILTKSIQGSLFFDLVMQDGLLSTPYHRIYFADRPDSYIEDFQLADDNENLPDTRFKLPIGMRLNFYLNEMFVIRSYYRYYYDDWGITAHTASMELPIKIGSKFTAAPLYRFYTQTASDYFAPKETHLSSDEYYTSDYDLSEFDANQYGLSLKYTDIFTKAKIWKFGLKNVELRYNHYQRSNDLDADIVTLGIKFVN
ncbi:MAG: DUF3570 domain-containing protein [Bacteroidota bacterium]